jgi:hypothetical protein
MKACEYAATHSKADVALLFRMWSEGLSAGEIARRFDVCVSTVGKWVQRYKLPPRPSKGTPEMIAPTPEEDAASLSGLALSPLVEELARPCRERHFAQRRGESDETTLQWRSRNAQA